MTKMYSTMPVPLHRYVTNNVRIFCYLIICCRYWLRMLGNVEDNMKSGVQGTLCELYNLRDLEKRILYFKRCEATHGYLSNSTDIPTVPLSVYPMPKRPRL